MPHELATALWFSDCADRGSANPVAHSDGLAERVSGDLPTRLYGARSGVGLPAMIEDMPAYVISEVVILD